MASGVLAVARIGQSPARRRAAALSALLVVLVLHPRWRAQLREFLRQLGDWLRQRLANGCRPALRKDFLGEGLQLQRNQRAVADDDHGPFADPRGAKQRGDLGKRSPEAFKIRGEAATRFQDFGAILPQWLTEGLHRGGFDSMRPIQRKVLPLAFGGRDVVGIAPTGSGKTLAFLVPALVHAAGQDFRLRPMDGPMALVLAPTRELAVQIGSVAEKLLKPSRERGPRREGGFNSAVLYGGPRRTDQLQTLRFQQSTHLVVATPGRLLDFLRTGAFTLRRVSFFILDEGDRMLDYGFEPDVTSISEQIRADRQMLFFSATWPAEVEEVARRLCSKGSGEALQRVQIAAGDKEEALQADPRQLQLPGHAGISLPPGEIQQVVEVLSNSSWGGPAMERKLPLLLRHLESALGGEIGETPGKALIFVGTRNAADELGMVVARHFGLDRCGVMHGARKQDQREATLQAFRDGRLRALVATDVLGRGVDIADVSLVVIFDFPGDIETYVHRIGRTGRNGRSGTAVALFEPQPWQPDLPHELAEVLRACGQEVPEALAKEEERNNFGAQCTSEAQMKPAWGESLEGPPPPLEERGSPEVASPEELGRAWDADGARVWGYSANGGLSEQGRLELREGGLLRTTWGWGRWELRAAAPSPSPPGKQMQMLPHCPPPSRPCPPLVGDDAESLPAATEKASAASESPPASATKLHHLALEWNDVTDIVALDDTGLGFELVSRNGRPASTYKKRTLGRALPGVAL